MNTATVLPDAIPVRHRVHEDIGLEFLTISVENGWDDVQKLCKKVLQFDGRMFTFSGWNSDRNECFFKRPLKGDVHVARFVRA